MSDATKTRLTRRSLLGGAAAGSTLAGLGAMGCAPEQQSNEPSWNAEFDVVCVGSGAAGMMAAVTASHAGAEVTVLEKNNAPGGTTVKSGAVFWIPNHYGLKARGIQDERDDCIQFLCRYAFPTQYSPDAAYFGVPQFDYERIAAFYDNGSDAVDFIREVGAFKLKEWRMWEMDLPAPDYLEHVPENKTSSGRPLAAVDEEGTFCWGYGMIQQMQNHLKERGVDVKLEHAVRELITDETGGVIGVVAQHKGRTLRIRARRGVIFATGGYAHNVDMINRYQDVFAYGSCARDSAQGDFIPISQKVSAKLANLQGAWRTAVVLEQALENRAVGTGMFVPPGDAMLLVNRHGKRFVNEHRNYNDRSRSHNTFDPTEGDFPNHFQFMIYDQRTATIVSENGQPPITSDNSYVLAASTLTELAEAIAQRLALLGERLAGYRLGQGFAENLIASVAQFNNYARAGKDPDFGRGDNWYDNQWHKVWGAFKFTEEHPENPYPNRTMHPLAETGPYFAVILAPGVLDTNGGPMTDGNAQVVDVDYRPVRGLYGAGNCICSPTRNAYAGAGGTIGPALTYGFIAARHAMAAAQSSV